MTVMLNHRCSVVVIATVLCAAICVHSTGVRAAETAAKKKIVFIPGPQSHGWTGHAYTADCKLLAQILNENVPAVQAVVLEGGWPRANDYSPLQDAAAIVIACDGNGLLGPESNWKVLDEIAKRVFLKASFTAVAYVYTGAGVPVKAGPPPAPGAPAGGAK